MVAYIVRRLLFAAFVMWGAVTIVFIVLRMVPGDPALVMLGPDASPDEIAALRESLGLTEPIPQQYLHYLASSVRLDFGDSIRLGGDAMGHVLERMPMTIQLSVAALMFAVVFGIGFGIVAALRVNTWADRVITVTSLVTHSLPSFWVGLVLILMLARGLQLLPSGGAGSFAHLLLPAFALALPFTAMVMRLTRSGLLEVINEGYIATARSKGLSERVVIFPHAIRNALIPIVTVVGLYFGAILGGTVVIETVFAWPGVGRLIVDSIGFRDYGVVQSGILVIAAIFVMINLIVDILYGYLDPRVRLAR
ncbi:ABC transporter permease [Occultella gossypii]|uniref:ABC transporter permease n=1 Tax=Occultella gossypii TaxID=2800820 RepID=A0ABS7SBR4_9MICO|nr:ABC transporter permease [Occultella gossypii]MBZ2197804.1 ABC transporter permease [Occultella gossypii]